MDATLQSNRDTLSRLSPEERQRLWFEGIRRPESFPVREEYLRQEFMVNGLVRGEKTAIQNVHTPFALTEKMVNKLKESIGPYPSGLKILVYNVEFLDILYRMGIMWNNEIWFVNENPLKVQWAKDIYRGNGDDQFIVQSWLNWNTDMKFDVICGNPPYQLQEEGNEESSTIWYKFVIKSIELLKEGGYLCYVHPAAWRGTAKSNGNVGNLLKGKQMKYLEIHNESDGLKTFGAETRYDWYILQNSPCVSPTKITGQNGEKTQLLLKNMPFVPSGMFKEVESLMAKPGEPTVTILHSESDYKHTQAWMSKSQSVKNTHPCVYSINYKGVPTFHYSSTNENGHFGIPKVIFASGRISSAEYIVDTHGTYGLTQWAKGIIDSPEILPFIAAAMRTKKFKRLMEACAVRYEINKGILATFRKDFWKAFVDENGNERTCSDV